MKNDHEYDFARKIHMTKPIENEQLKFWSGKYHYQEAINCPIPPPVCACCSQSRWPDREIILLTDQSYHPKEPPTDIVEVIINKKDFQ